VRNNTRERMAGHKIISVSEAPVKNEWALYLEIDLSTQIDVWIGR
jgi:hypothetical protein